MLIEEQSGIFRGAQPRQDCGVDAKIALAAAGRDDHVGLRQQIRLAFDARAVERKAGRISPDALPRLHLPLIALLGNLLVEVDGCQRMNDVRRA